MVRKYKKTENIAERYSLLKGTDKYDQILGSESMEHSKK
ncbi:hypothetical protein CLPUN_18910 [Clostridium puniceum]|uniref:Uncharacterized protein n=1 Tax=Clostridium puniceum TaxID=29367 RepID=A0A1S8TLN8_9CLOT|nr:hypothetical protein CLPUN_18910 [Clostridium puniceum]